MSEGVAIGVNRGHDMEVVRVKEFRDLAVAAVTWGQLVHDPLAGSRGDPLTSVDAAVNPHNLFVVAAARWNLADDKKL